MSQSTSATPTTLLTYEEAFPGSRRVLVDGPLGVRVPMREIALSGGKSPVRVYDTSGPQGVDVREVPLVYQYNKQDLPSDLILTGAELDDALNFREVRSYTADALGGVGVFETLKGISELVLRRLASGAGSAA